MNEKFSNIFLEQLDWIVPVISFIVVVWLAKKLWGIKPIEIIQTLFREFEQLASRKITVGAINVCCVFSVLVFGFFLVYMDKFHLITPFIERHFGNDQAVTFENTVGVAPLFYGLIAVVLVSLLAVSRSDSSDK